jgi:hypothetical protein
MECGELTTGQKLLASLHSSQAARQERYASTVQAKMAEARYRLNTQGLVPKHAVKADLAIFGDANTEVHRLLPEAPQEQVRCKHSTATPTPAAVCLSWARCLQLLACNRQ